MAVADTEPSVSTVPDTRFTPLSIRVAILCALIAMFDGFDTQAIAYVAPAIAEAWHLNIAAFGPIFAVGLVGLMIGALVCSPLADRYGRKVMIVASVLAFAVCALLTARAQSLVELGIYRLLTGIGLGGAMPNIIALTNEHSPAHRRASLVTAMFCGFPLGSTLGGFISVPLIQSYGWQSVFVVGGLMPLALLAALVFLLPESARAPADASRPSRRFPVFELFSAGRARHTALVWLAFFMNLLVMYFLTNWLPRYCAPPACLSTSPFGPRHCSIWAVWRAVFSWGG